MAYPNKVWYRKDIGWWMVTLDGKKIRLTEGRANRKLAEQKFHELKAVQARPADRSDARVSDVVDRFLGWSKLHRSDKTNRNHVWYGQKFSEYIGYLKTTELGPIMLPSGWMRNHFSCRLLGTFSASLASSAVRTFENGN
jgi:hypothetical protein